MPAYIREYTKTSAAGAVAAAPPTTAADSSSVSLLDASAFQVFLDCNVAGNFTAGTLQCWGYDEDGTRYRNEDLDLTVLKSGATTHASPRGWSHQDVSVRYGRVAYVPNSVTHDGVGATTLTTKILVYGARVSSP